MEDGARHGLAADGPDCSRCSARDIPLLLHGTVGGANASEWLGSTCPYESRHFLLSLHASCRNRAQWPLFY